MGAPSQTCLPNVVPNPIDGDDKNNAHGSVLWAVFLVGQAGTALSAAASQYLAAVRGSHSLSEPMDFASLSLFGLISSQHIVPLLPGSGPDLRRGRPPGLWLAVPSLQSAIGGDSPAILNYTLNNSPLSRKTRAFQRIFHTLPTPCGKWRTPVQNIGSDGGEKPSPRGEGLQKLGFSFCPVRSTFSYGNPLCGDNAHTAWYFLSHVRKEAKNAQGGFPLEQPPFSRQRRRVLWDETVSAPAAASALRSRSANKPAAASAGT